jgi:hypothetical protein
MINIALRNTRNYLKGGVDHASSTDDLDTIKNAVNWWNENFNLDFLELRLKMREVSLNILKSQSIIDKIYWHYMPSYQVDKVYAPMDDDDIFLIDHNQYQKCNEKLNDDCNAVILGIYVQKIDENLNYKYIENPDIPYLFHTNNFLFKNTTETSHCKKWAGAHDLVFRLPYIKYEQIEQIKTSVHLVHPISVSLLRPRSLITLPDWSNKKQVDTMATILNNYVNETEYKKIVPLRFHPYIEKFKEIFNDVKPK